ncbi:MAG TPA: hypothetical protein VGD56_16710 [Gemmatirosa sp.]
MGSIGDFLSGIGSDIENGISDVAGWIGNHPAAAAAGASAVAGAVQNGEAGALQQQAIDLAKQQYAAGAPFRAAGLAARTKVGSPQNLAFMTQGSNPYLPKTSTPADLLAPGQSATRMLPYGSSTLTNTGKSAFDTDGFYASPVGQALNGPGGALQAVGRLGALGFTPATGSGAGPAPRPLPIVGNGLGRVLPGMGR